jgi:invasion protein IalB
MGLGSSCTSFECQERIATLEAALAAQEKKYEDCPHPKGEQYWPCACSYDKPSDVCAVHAPQLLKAQERERHIWQAVAEQLTVVQVNQLSARVLELEK